MQVTSEMDIGYNSEGEVIYVMMMSVDKTL